MMPPNGQTPYLCIARMVMISWIHGWSKNFPARIMRLDTIFMAFLPCFMDLGMLNPSSFCFKASLLRKCWNTDEADLEKNLDGKLMPLPFKKKGLVSNVDKPLKRLDGVVFIIVGKMVRLERGNFDMPTNQFRIEISWNMRIWPVGESLNVEGEVFFLVPWGWAREKKTILRRKQLNAKCETTSFGTSQKPIATCPIGDVFWYIWLKWTTSNICKPCARWYVNPFQEILHAMYALFANIQLSLFPAAVVHLLPN